MASQTTLQLEAIEKSIQPINFGADGAVYTLENDTRHLIKLFHDIETASDKLDKLETMIASPPTLHTIAVDDNYDSSALAWPNALVLDSQNRLRGYQMPKIEKRYADSLDIWMQEKSRQVFNVSSYYRDRLTIACKLAQLVATLHEKEIFVIDLKPSNTLVYDDIFQPVLIDCDSFSLTDAQGTRYPAHQYTPDYIAPEALKQQLKPDALGREQDLYALAVMIFQLMNQGLHPFQGGFRQAVNRTYSNDERVINGWYAYGLTAHDTVTPAKSSIHESFPHETRVLFDRAFATGDANTIQRPSAQEWFEHLLWLLDDDNNLLHQCQRNPHHQYFGSRCLMCDLGVEQIQPTMERVKTRPASVNLPQQTSATFRRINRALNWSLLLVPAAVIWLSWTYNAVSPLFAYTGGSVLALIGSMIGLGRFQTKYKLGSQRKSIAFGRFTRKVYLSMMLHIGAAFLLNFFGVIVYSVSWLFS